MSSRIFLSYRREDSAGQAGRVSDRLIHDFGRECLFVDVDNIPLGTDFVKRLHNEVGSCDVLLAVIGPRWLDFQDENNERRIDNPNDFVRIEIGAALQRDITVVPILVDGAKIPNKARLPDDIKGLSDRHGLEVRNSSFHTDMDRLVRELRASLFKIYTPKIALKVSPAQHDKIVGFRAGHWVPSKFRSIEWTTIGIWAIASVAGLMIFMLAVILAANMSLLNPTMYWWPFLLLLALFAFLITTPMWLRQRSNSVRAAVIGFFSMQGAILSVISLIHSPMKDWVDGFIGLSLGIAFHFLFTAFVSFLLDRRMAKDELNELRSSD